MSFILPFVDADESKSVFVLVSKNKASAVYRKSSSDASSKTCHYVILD